MLIDKEGNILTDSEIRKMCIKDVEINNKDTEMLTTHLDELVKDLESTEEYEQADKKYNTYLQEIKNLMPVDKKDLVMKLDDSYTEILILIEEFFYKSGFVDCLRSRTILKKFLGVDDESSK